MSDLQAVVAGTKIHGMNKLSSCYMQLNLLNQYVSLISISRRKRYPERIHHSIWHNKK